MDEHIDLLTDIRDHLRDIATLLNEINTKLDGFGAAHDVGDISTAIEGLRTDVSTDFNSVLTVLDRIDVNTGG